MNEWIILYNLTSSLPSWNLDVGEKEINKRLGSWFLDGSIPFSIITIIFCNKILKLSNKQVKAKKWNTQKKVTRRIKKRSMEESDIGRIFKFEKKEDWNILVLSAESQFDEIRWPNYFSLYYL